MFIYKHDNAPNRPHTPSILAEIKNTSKLLLLENGDWLIVVITETRPPPYIIKVFYIL